MQTTHRSAAIPLLALAGLLLPALVSGCRGRVAPATTTTAKAPASAPAEAQLPPLPWTAGAVAHAGVGTDPKHSDGCRAAVDAALAVLAKGGDPLDAAVAGVVVLEDDPRFNAGTGSRVRLDGETVQMDASLMDSDGRFAAVAVIEKVKNPVRVARAVIDTPHLLLAGDGATRFARRIGMPPYDPATAEMKAATREIQQRLLKADPNLPRRWRDFDWRSKWNFERTLKEAGLDKRAVGGDTVGIAVRAADGRFAAALSTGGTSITLRGRVGDVPVYGAGLYAGKHGAMAATGTGERIIEANLGRQVQRWLAAGLAPARAARRAVAELKEKGWIGLIVIGPRTLAAAAGHPMAWAGRQAGSTDWSGPPPQ